MCVIFFTVSNLVNMNSLMYGGNFSGRIVTALVQGKSSKIKIGSKTKFVNMVKRS